MDLVAGCYRVTAQFPKGEQFGLTAQIRRCAVSIPCNVAEGHNRRSHHAYRNHVSIALGSQAELETQIELAGRLHYVADHDLPDLMALTQEVGCMLHGLVKALERSSPSA
ncbi:MAG: four helix bundle protein [Acidobacteria bacterium]|nr:four helix bundle protein [Acidobacteriota bacterium]